MRSAKEIRESLDRVGTRLVRIDNELLNAEQDLGRILREANSHPEITTTDAARLALVSRPQAYKLMAKVGGSDV